jgi:hypothetical protein
MAVAWESELPVTNVDCRIGQYWYCENGKYQTSIGQLVGLRRTSHFGQGNGREENLRA